MKMKIIELTANQSLILKAIDKNFKSNNNYIVMTIENNIIPYLPKCIKISKSTIYRSIRILGELNIIQYKNIEWYWYSIKKWKEYNNLVSNFL